MAQYARPGVYIEERLSTANAASVQTLETAVFMGSISRGPSTPTRVSSWAEFSRYYGGFEQTGDLPHALYQYFNNGGRNAYVYRVLPSSGAITATRTLNDRAGTPLATLRVDALNQGAWGNSIYLDITNAASGTSGKFDLVVYYGGTDAQNVVERWTELSMTDTDPRYVENVINGVGTGSNYITVTDLDSATAAPNDAPALQTGTVLATGANGSAPAAGQYQAAIDPGLDQITQSFSFNLPGVVDTTILNSAITYAEARGDVFVVIDTAANLTPSAAGTYATSLNVSSYAAVYYPRYYAPDPSSTQRNTLRLFPPGAALIGKMAEIDAARGVHKAPAGLSVNVRGAVGLERRLSNDDLDTLHTNRVNAIRHLPGAGIVVMGARTLSRTGSDQYITVRRSLIYLKKSLLASTQFALFEPNDQTLWTALAGVVEQFLRDFWLHGGLRGATADEAFYVKCDGENNTTTTVANGEVHVEVGVALQYPAEFIIIQIGQWEGGRSTVELTTTATLPGL